MNRFALFGFAVLMLLLVPLTAQASEDFRYIAPAEVKAMLEKGEPVHILDIQVADEFAKGHLPGAMETCAYPVKSEEDKAKLDARLDDLRGDDAPIVIVCPRGKGGAKRTRDHLLEKGFSAERLLILEGGQKGWPYGGMIEKK